MIVSFHPCYNGDRNIICAGREPGPDERDAIKSADAVILPQGCRQTLYEMVHDYCPHVFPNYDARFKYPGKLGDMAIFKRENLPHPETHCFTGVREFMESSGNKPKGRIIDLPFVFKFTWGGEGETVFLIRTDDEFEKIMDQVEKFEWSGSTGFLIQEYIPTNRSLRVVIIGEWSIAYWRVSNSSNGFGTSLAKGAVIDKTADPDLQMQAIHQIREFCRKTGINLAAFDAIFSDQGRADAPLYLEINYYFGRRGLGGSEAYYTVLVSEIVNWLDRFGLSVESD